MNTRNYNYLKENPKLAAFVRHNPMWYRYLSRDPSRIVELEKEAKKFYGKTFPQRLEKVSNQMHLISMFMQLAQSVKD